MDLILYIIKIRLNQIYKELSSIWVVISYLFFTLIVIGYSKLFLLEYFISTTEKMSKLTPLMVFINTIFYLGVISFLRLFLPSYTPIKRFVHCFYPVNNFIKYILNLTCHSFRPFVLFAIFFVILSSYQLNAFGLFFFTAGISILITANLLIFIVQCFIEYKQHWLILTGFLVCVGLLIGFLVEFIQYNNYTYTIICITSANLILFVFGYLVSLSENKKAETQKWLHFFKNTNVNLIVRNEAVRLPILIGIGLKCLFILIDLYFRKTKGKPLFDQSYIYWIYLSPLILFTYVFNNMLIFWKTVFMNIYIKTNSFTKLANVLFYPIILSIILDFTITSSLLIFCNRFTLFYLLFYLSSATVLLMTSFFWSVVYPLKLKSNFQVKGSVSFISFLASFIMVILISFLSINFWFYLMLPVLLFISVLAFKSSTRLIAVQHYKLIEKTR